GTRINGKTIQEAPLHDGDALQIGPFSFQARLPASTSGAPPVAVPVEAVLPRLQRSRRKLAQLALRLRRRLKAQRGQSQQGSTQQADALHAKQRECAARAARLEEAKRSLAADRARHDQEVTAFQKRVAEEERVLETSGSALALANEMEAQRLDEWRR